VPTGNLQHSSVSPKNVIFRSSERRASATYGRALREHRSLQFQLKEALSREEALRRQNDDLIQQQELLSKLFTGREDAAKRITLTPRESEILGLVLAGNPSKNIAADLHISMRTVENHRACIMKKTGSTSLPALVRFVLAAAWHDASQTVYPNRISNCRVAC
jgi:DNA-binding NarL/FixJ family response regulator